MKMIKIVNGFTQMTDAVLLVRADVIHNAMTGNPNFPSPVPTLQELLNTVNGFRVAVEKADGGNRQDIAVKNSIREELILRLHLLGNYVLFTSANDEVKATSSGFRIGKTPAPGPAVTVPQGLQLTNGLNKGELMLKFKKVQSARAYRYEITPAPLTADSSWNSSSDTVTRASFSGLESGKEYYCRVAAVGIKGQEVYSDVVSRITQ